MNSINFRKKMGLWFGGINLVIFILVSVFASDDSIIGLFLPNIILAFPVGIFLAMLLSFLPKFLYTTGLEIILFASFTTLYWYAVGYFIGFMFEKTKKA